MIIPALDTINANEAGYELVTVSDFREMVTEAMNELVSNSPANAAVLQNFRETEERYACMIKFMPSAKVVLWKREEQFITLAPSVDSLRHEFPFLNHRQKVMK